MPASRLVRVLRMTCVARWCVARASVCGACVAQQRCRRSDCDTCCNACVRCHTKVPHVSCVDPRVAATAAVYSLFCGKGGGTPLLLQGNLSSRLAETSGASGASIPFAPAEYQTRLTPELACNNATMRVYLGTQMASYWMWTTTNITNKLLNACIPQLKSYE